ncbi:probable glutamate receptor [Macrobrachium rosenbergii]|uniref:probable glutamate receptor n=1 Tax=Macrobrachium rosenbergii TaxID=79674 RepID=UPI0034D4E860
MLSFCVLVVLTTILPPVESGTEFWSHGTERQVLQQCSKRTSATSSLSDDLRSILQSLDAHLPEQVGILFDTDYEDYIRDMWPHLSMDLSSLSIYEYNETRKMLRSLIEVSAKSKILLLVLCSPASIVSLFQVVQMERLQSHFIKWVLVASMEPSVFDIIDGLEGKIFEGTEVAIMNRLCDGKFGVFAAQVDSYGLTRFLYKGKWNSKLRDGGQRLPSLIDIKADIGSTLDMKGRRMTVAILELWPFVKFDKVLKDGTVEAQSGSDILILNTISSLLNFTYRLVTPGDNTWGFPQPDGTINGMIGMVARREVAFAICGISIHELRKRVVDYTTMYSQGFLRIFSRAPKQKNRALAVLSPFTLQVWIGITISVLGTATVLSLQSKLLQLLRMERALNASEYYFNIFRSLVAQGNLIKAKLWSQRFILYFWYLFCLINAALYSGMLTAVITVPEFETPIDALTDLARAVKDGFTLGVTRETTNEYIFKRATGGIYKEVWDLFNHKDRSKSFVDKPTTGMKWILEKKFVFIWYDILGKNAAEGLGRSKFHISRESFFPDNFAIPIPPGAPYKEPFDKILLKVIEGGLIMKWENDAFRRTAKPKILDEDTRKFSAFTLKHLQAAFFLLILGFLLAVTALFLEVLVTNLASQ